MASKPEKARTRAANGALFADKSVDLRTTYGRRYVEIYNAVISDLGGDGNCSEAQRQLARRAATLAMHCESVEARMVMGEKLEVTYYVRASNALLKVLNTLGLKRDPRRVGGDADDHAAMILDGDADEDS